MINLTPISKAIQKRLFEKMKVLGREQIYDSSSPRSKDTLRLSDLSVKSTFIKMVSGTEKPVILNGGELTEDNKMAVGYDEVYGPRAENPNKYKRPIPGIKSIEVQFKGGQRALRQATINWVCWTFEDLDRLVPHFLAHGKTVGLEWGWVYNKKQFQNLKSIIKNDGEISPDGFKDYRKVIDDNNGDSDFMQGVIKNYEYTTRDDGGFDCTTTIISTGISILDMTSPSDSTVDKVKLYDIKESDSTDKKIEKLQAILDDEEDLKNIFYNNSLGLPIFVNGIDEYLLTLPRDDEFLGGGGGPLGTVRQYEYIPEESSNLFRYSTNSFIYNTKTKITDDIETPQKVKEGVIDDAWIRWGWFEDNVITPFFSLVSEDTGKIMSEFRSVDRILKDGIPQDEFEPVQISNHRALETTNTNKFILPGQFSPGIHDTQLMKIATIVNDTDKFNQFRVEGDETRGYLRNILIHIDVLKECFNFSEGATLQAGLEQLLNVLMDECFLWNLEIEPDTVESNRVRIIDTKVTFYPNWSDTFKPDEVKSKVNDNLEITTHGVFHFPVWQSDSITKAQTFTTKVPNSMQLAAMYGQNLDRFKVLNDPDNNVNDEGKASGAVTRDEKLKDRYYKNTEFGYRINQKIGVDKGDESQPIQLGQGLDIGSSADLFENITDTITNDINAEINKIQNTKVKEKKKGFFARLFGGGSDEDVEAVYTGKLLNPALIPEGDVNTFLSDITQKDIDKEFNSSLQKLYNQRYTEGKLKDQFIDGNDEIMRQGGKGRSSEVPMLIPFDLELTIDGIGGIYPGNSFHSTYLPTRYKKETIFQAFDVNHEVGPDYWNTKINGKMRASLAGLFTKLYTVDEKIANLIKKIRGKINPDTVKDPETGLYGGLYKQNPDGYVNKYAQPTKLDLGGK